MRIRPFPFVLLAAAGIVAGAIWVTQTRPGDAAPAARRTQPPVAVELTPLRKATVRDVGVFSGTLLPRSQFVVAAKVAGRLEKLLVNAGDEVVSGQAIAELDDVEFVQQLRQAEAELKVTEANVESCASDMDAAGREFDRAKALLDKKIASASEFDEAQARYKSSCARHKVAEAQVLQKQAAFKTDELRLSYTKVSAEWSNGGGRRMVGQRFVDEGALLKANDPIVSILDDSVLKAVIGVIERDYPKIRVGQRARLTADAHPGRTFDGKVVRIAPLLSEASRQGRIEIEVPNADGDLRAGMSVRVMLEFAAHDDATVVPTSAIVNRHGRRGVFVADESGAKARFVPLTIGIVEGEVAEVVEAADLSGQVVTLGQHLLSDGAAIRFASGQDAADGRGKRGAPAPGGKRPGAPQ